MNDKVSIVIPTWNHFELLTRCLESVRAQTRAAHEVIVVDDGSTDSTASLLERDWPDVRVIAHRENAGFARAANTGIRAATGDWVFMLNNDVWLEPDCLERLLAQAGIGNAQLFTPVVLFDEPRTRVYCAGDRVRRSGRPESIGHNENRDMLHVQSSVFGVSFCAALIRNDVFKRAGVLDERFVAYLEDADFCFRARLAGFRAECVESATAYHVGSASLSDRRWWRSRQCFVNHGLMVAKNMPLRLIVRHFPAIAGERLHQARSAFSAARCARGSMFAVWCIVGAWASLMVNLPAALRKRSHIQRVRILTSRQIDQLLSP